MRRIPVIDARGEPRERGQVVGEATRDLISANIEDYHLMFAKGGARSREEVFAFARRLVAPIRSYAPELEEEMHGIAEGAHQSYDDILALNCRTEVLYSLLAKSGAGSECTSLGARPEATRTGTTYIGENWDWRECVTERTVVVRQEYRARKAAVFTEAGFVGKIGLNDAGIGVCANLLSSSHDHDASGVPFHVILRKILDAGNLHWAIRSVTGCARGSSGNYLIGSAGGEIVDIEATPRMVGYLLPDDDGLLSHANHFEDPQLAGFDTHRDQSTMTVVRSSRARRLLAADRGQIDEGSFIRVFRDHFSAPHSICRHADPDVAPLARSITGASIIMDLENRRMLVAAGPPCQNEYQTIQI